jgi:hypothetical protein
MELKRLSRYYRHDINRDIYKKTGEELENESWKFKAIVVKLVTEMRDSILQKDLVNMPVNIQDYYRGGFVILCEEFIYSIILIIFLPLYWYRSAKLLGHWLMRNTILRLTKRH